MRLRNGAPAAPGVGAALATSLYTATISTAIVALLGIPLAYLIARARPLARRAMTALVALPLALPPLMSGLLLLWIVGPYTTAGELFGGNLTDTRAGIVLAQTFVAAPFLVLAAQAAFAGVDPVLEEVAACLGHRPLARFLRVSVPAALPGIAAGLLLAWLRAFGEFGATVILAYHPYTLPVFTFVQFDATGLPATMLPIAASLGAALLVLALVQLPLPRRRAPAPAGIAPEASDTAGRQPGGPAPIAIEFSLARRLGDFSLALSHRAATPRLALLGPSGAGTTLTLRLLAGLLDGEPGRVSAGGRRLEALPPERRGVGYVPQQSALLPRRTVWRQVTFGTRADAAGAAAWIGRLGLAGLEDRYPEELSGGQGRRVALARALADRPRLLLLDEPFTGLDTPLRHRLISELRRIQREAGLSTVIVTHDPEEAALLAEELIVIEHGRVLQAGLRADVFRTPASARVAELLGLANTFEGVAAGAGGVRVGEVLLEGRPGGPTAGTAVVCSVRPESIALVPEGRYRARVLQAVDLGREQQLTIAIGGGLSLAARCAGPLPPEGAGVSVEIDPAGIASWPAGAAAAAAAPDGGETVGSVVPCRSEPPMTSPSEKRRAPSA